MEDEKQKTRAELLAEAAAWIMQSTDRQIVDALRAAMEEKQTA